MLQIVCLNSHNYLGRGAEYVAILHDMVKRNLPEGFPGKFVCFTDDDADYGPEIEKRPLPHSGLRGWFNKLALFKAGLFPDDDRILFLDLDTCITGPLDQIAAYDGEFAILRDFYRPHGLGSAIVSWKSSFGHKIWTRYVAEGFPEPAGGDQAFIEDCFAEWGFEPDRWQEVFPGDFVSYKLHARYGIPKGAKVVVFHGLPRPHECKDWVPYVWKIGGGTTAELVTTANVSRETILGNIRSAVARKGAKWLKMGEAHDGTALVCAGGPSLKDELGSVRAHQDAGAKVYSVNNSAQFLLSNGILVDAQVILDARLQNLQFVSLEVPECLFASQCHPLVLSLAEPNLTLWHPLIDGIFDVTGEGDGLPYIGGCTTAGLSAVVLAYVQGFRKIHLYGFDSCYQGDENHAYKQPLNDGERIVEVIVGGKSFRCAPWMATQADDFRQLAPELIALGCELYVHGTGLIPTLAETMESGEVAGAEIRAQEILRHVNGNSHPIGAEVGVFAGDLSKRLLGKSPRLKLYMVDSWGANQSPEFVATGDFHSTLTQEAQDLCCEVAKAVTSFAGDRAVVLRKRSLEAAKDVPDGSLDFAFIDADHSYEGCRDDIRAWFPKVKSGGFISGHDYENNQHAFGPMVKRAVDEFVAANNLTLDLGENWTWFAVKP